MPEPARFAILTRLGRAPKDIGGATAEVQRICLLSAGQMQYLFPEAKIWHERVMGLTKSLVAIRRGAEAGAQAAE